MEPEAGCCGKDAKPEKSRDSERDRENERQGMMETEMEILRRKDREMRESGDKQKETKKRESEMHREERCQEE